MARAIGCTKQNKSLRPHCHKHPHAGRLVRATPGDQYPECPPGAGFNDQSIENWKKHTVEYKKGDILGIVIQHELEHLEEGHCQVYDWWKDPEGKKKELEERFKKTEEKTSSNEVVESEDMKREKEEAKNERAVEVTKEALRRGEFVEMPEDKKLDE